MDSTPDNSVQILSDLTVYMKYARYLPALQRRETWDEIVNRNKAMHKRQYPQLSEEIEDAYRLVREKKVLPSMRSMQFAGKPIEVNNSRMYNCSYLPVDHPDAFSEIMFLLLGGSGVGFGIQKHQVNHLPAIQGPLPLHGQQRPKRYLIGDSIEGWSDAVKVLVESYFYGKKPIYFDFRDIRPKGSELVTSGGKAPGPQPLRDCLTQLTNVLENALQERGRGTKLCPIEVHDMVCHIADAVLAGGIRRAALISLFSFDDNEMMEAKAGPWWELNPQRARANNSAVALRRKITRAAFDYYWDKVRNSRSGEPGIFFTNDKSYGMNPCAEIALKPFGFCNLTEINVSNIQSQADYNERARVAAFLGTLQAGYTDFHYLRDVWRDTAEEEALLGVSQTGIGSGAVLRYDMEEAARIAVEENYRVAELIGINPAKRVTTGKPSGTTSLVLGTSSGVHAWHNDYYIRRMRVGKTEPIYHYLRENHPELVEDEVMRPETMAVIGVPQKAPQGAILRGEDPIDLLERVKRVYREWILNGHNEGQNTHNQSVTVSVREDEWDRVGEWMWENRDHYSGITVLPYDGGTYAQAPFEDITRQEFERLSRRLPAIDLTQVREEEDQTDLMGELACGPDGCEPVGSTEAERNGAPKIEVNTLAV